MKKYRLEREIYNINRWRPMYVFKMDSFIFYVLFIVYYISVKSTFGCDLNELFRITERREKMGETTMNLIEMKRSKNKEEPEWLIVGGRLADIKNFPYVAYINVENTTVYFGCGGGIIDPKHLLTAAHCVVHVDEGQRIHLLADNISVLIGSEDRTKADEFNVEKIFVPSLFVKRCNTLLGDLAVLRLCREVTLGGSVSAVHLPPPGYSQKLKKYQTEGAECFVAGWGHRSYQGYLQTKLRYIKIKLITTEKCSSIWLRHKTNISDRYHICTYSKAKDTCNGDSGSLLVCEDEGEFEPPSSGTKKKYAWGVTSFGNNCADQKFPGVYTRIDTFYQFIVNITRGGDLDPEKTIELHCTGICLTISFAVISTTLICHSWIFYTG